MLLSSNICLAVLCGIFGQLVIAGAESVNNGNCGSEADVCITQDIESWKLDKLPLLAKELQSFVRQNNLLKVKAIFSDPNMPPQGRELLLSYRDPDGDNALNVAAWLGHLDLVKYVVEKLGANVNNPGSQQRTPLMHACSNGQLDVAVFLVLNGADLDVQDDVVSSLGNKAIHLAAERGNVELVSFLLDQRPQWIEERSARFQRTPLLHAAEGGKMEVVKFLIETKHADLDAVDDKETSLGLKAIHFAAEFGHVDVVAYLLEKRPNWVEEKSLTIGRTPLLHAAVSGKLECVKFLVETKKANMEAEEARGKSAIHIAADEGHVELVGYLLEKRPAWLEKRSSRFGRTPLLHAAAGENLEMLTFLIETKKANIDAVDDKEAGMGLKAIHFAAELGSVETVRYLLKKRPQWIEEKSARYRRTPLLHAAAGGKLEIVRFLVEAKDANIDATGSYGEKAIHRAASAGHADVVAYLLEQAPYQIVAKDKEGQTALDWAKIASQNEVISRLLKTRTTHTVDV